MPLLPWKTLDRKDIFRNPWWTYRRDSFLLPNGETGEYFYVHTNGSSMIIPVLDDGRIAMVRQYRYLCDRDSLEFPCGGVKDASDYHSTAQNELEEETGFRTQDLQEIGTFNPFNGVTTEFCKVYLARGLEYVGAKPERTEQFEHLQLMPPEIDARIRSGEIWDGMTIAAWGIGRSLL